MNRLFLCSHRCHGRSAGQLSIMLSTVLWCASFAAIAQNAVPGGTANAPFSIPATHVLGLENTKANCAGHLSIQDGALQFAHGRNPGEQIKIRSVRGVFLGEESKQVGGVPMKLGKSAVPFGGGRVVSLFAHKKFDTVTVEFVDTDGGVHGAIFQLAKGQGELLKNEMVARGVPPGPAENQPTKQETAEVTHENK